MALELGGSIYILCDTLNGYQPLSHFNYKTYENDYVIEPNFMPNEYIHWLHIFDDVFGNRVDVLYPIEPLEKGKIIHILYQGSNEEEDQWKVIEWEHGKPGLFEQEIIPLLTQEWKYRHVKVDKNGEIYI